MADILKKDLYLLLNVTLEATEKEIVKAYRKKALKCHPDKNPDNPKAAEEFHELSKALEILTDESARAAYDKALKAKKAAELRHRVLNSKRKKFKEDLEAREKLAQTETEIVVTHNLEAEIERLRKEGSKLLEQEKIRLLEELNKPQDSPKPDESEEEKPAPRLKVKWKAKKGDPENGGYSQEFLEKAFEKYGDVTALIVSLKKKGSAIVEFSSSEDAAMAIQNEIGLTNNPLKLTWLSGEPAPAPVYSNMFFTANAAASSSGVNFCTLSTSPQQTFPTLSSTTHDYEDIVMMKMRQAQERKQLIEQMKKEDGAS